VSTHPDTHLVLHLQSLDQRIAGLDKEIAALPKHIAVIEKALESHNRKLEADRAALAANQKERKLKEGEIQLHQQKISKLRDQMSGAKNNEQYKAFQHEIEFIEKEISKAEDRILELMGESESLDLNVKKAEIALKAEKTSVEAEKTKARERTAADQSQLDQLRGERKEAVTKLPAPIVKEYERIRKKWNGTAIAEVIGGRCSACQIVLRPQHLQDLRRSEHLMACESCGRYLYLNPPVLVEDGARVDLTSY
jgi:predicted  nucleic acid-binding Zn-ribbon protein